MRGKSDNWRTREMMPYGREKLRQEIRANSSQSKESHHFHLFQNAPNPYSRWLGKEVLKKKVNSSNLPNIAVRGKHTFKERIRKQSTC